MSFSKLKRVLYYAFTVFTLWILVHLSLSAYIGLSNNIHKSSFGLVFGNTVNVDGSLSNRLKARLDKAIELYHQNLIDSIYVSGALGKEGFYEGSKMASYLITHQIPKTVIIIDNKGINTLASIKNFDIDTHSKSVILISQYHHLSRAKMTAETIINAKVSTAYANYFELRDVYSLCREFIAFYKYLLILKL